MTVTPHDNAFLPQQGGYRKLKAFQVSTVIYDITYHFANKYFTVGDRTVDQMVQAARSGRQNIAEGNVAGTTSRETEIKLTNVARASLHELLLDYEDFLRHHKLQLWADGDARSLQAHRFCRSHNDTADYMPRIEVRSAETVANIAIILLRQCDILLTGLIERLKADFLEKGGIKEEMFRARKEARDKQWGR